MQVSCLRGGKHYKINSFDKILTTMIYQITIYFYILEHSHFAYVIYENVYRYGRAHAWGGALRVQNQIRLWAKF